MGAFIIAAIVFVGSVCLAFLVAFGQGMATVPQFDKTPVVIVVCGGVLALLIVASHWAHIGW